MRTDHYDELLTALRSCVDRAKGGHLKVREVFASLRQDSYGFICIVQTLPFLQPLSLGPISTAVGASFCALGWQMFRGRETPWLPRKLLDMELSATSWGVLLKTCEKVLQVFHKLTRPRLQGLVRSSAMKRVCGAMVLLSGILLAVPLAGVPFSNTLPVLCILFLCIGELEDDGLMIILAVLALVLTIAYFGFLGWLLLLAGGKAVGALGG